MAPSIKPPRTKAPNLPEFKPLADPAATIVFGNARFTLLTPFLLRLEWSATRAFEDRASFAVTHRLQPVPEHRVKKKGGEIVIETQALTLKYRDTPKGFTPQTLSIAMKNVEGNVVWKPGMKDRGNLSGTTRTLDMVSGSAPLEQGILSRDGWSVYDDSGKIVFDNSDWPWAVHRADRKAIDWYFFGYGRNYRLALQDFMKVSGRIPLPPRYVFGSWWSRYWPYTDKEFEALVKEHEDHDVPLDVLVIDMDWHLDGWTGYTWDPRYFPDPSKFLKWCQKKGLRTTLNLHPADGVGKHEAQFTQMALAMGLDPNKVDRVPFDCTSRRLHGCIFRYIASSGGEARRRFLVARLAAGHRLQDGGTRSAALAQLPALDGHGTEQGARGTLPPARDEPLGRARKSQVSAGFFRRHLLQLGIARLPAVFHRDGRKRRLHLLEPRHRRPSAGALRAGTLCALVQWGAVNPVLRVHSTRNPSAERRIWTFPRMFTIRPRRRFTCGRRWFPTFTRRRGSRTTRRSRCAVRCITTGRISMRRTRRRTSTCSGRMCWWRRWSRPEIPAAAAHCAKSGCRPASGSTSSAATCTRARRRSSGWCRLMKSRCMCGPAQSSR
jgi:hypothetical protein